MGYRPLLLWNTEQWTKVRLAIARTLPVYKDGSRFLEDWLDFIPMLHGEIYVVHGDSSDTTQWLKECLDTLGIKYTEWNDL